MSVFHFDFQIFSFVPFALCVLWLSHAPDIGLRLSPQRAVKISHHSSLCLAQVKLSHVPNILKLKSHFLKCQNPWLCKEWKTSQNSQIHILLGMQKGWDIQNKWRVSLMSRKNQELAFARRESTVDGTAALGFSKWRWKPPKILSPILKAMWQRKSKSISGFFESNHRPMSSKKPENIRIIPGGVKNFAHSTIGFSRQSREEINFNCGNPRRQFWPRMIEFKSRLILPIPPGQEVCNREDRRLRDIPLNQEELLASTSIDSSVDFWS